MMKWIDSRYPSGLAFNSFRDGYHMIRVLNIPARTLLLGLLFVFAMVFSATAAAELRIAVVNVSKVVREAPQSQAARKRMESEFSSRRARLEKMQEKLIADAERLKRDGAVMSAEARDKLEEDIRSQRRDLNRLQQEYNEDVALKEKEELKSLREDILTVINKVAEEQNYDLIIGDGVIYASDQVDLTQTIIGRLQSSR